MIKNLLLVAALVIGFSVSMSAEAGMRCDGKLINVGDLVYKVSKYCGTPDYIQKIYKADGGPKEYFLVYEKNGGGYVIKIFDGRVKEIKFTRFN